MIKPGIIEKQIVEDDIIATLEELGVEIATYHGKPRISNNSELKCFCPFHDDHPKPSFSINLRTGFWHCWSNCGGGNWDQLLERLGRQDIKVKPTIPDSVKKVHGYRRIFREKTEELHKKLTILIDRTTRSLNYHEKFKSEYFISETEDRMSELSNIRESDDFEASMKTLNNFIEDTLKEINVRMKKV